MAWLSSNWIFFFTGVLLTLLMVEYVSIMTSGPDTVTSPPIRSHSTLLSYPRSKSPPSLAHIPRQRIPKERPLQRCNTSILPHDGRGIQRRIPQAIVIGVMKGGTGAIKQFLSANPSITIRHGEPDFFSRDSIYSKGLSHYRSLMPRSRENQITLEGSPAYLVVKETPRRIRRAQPCAKLIATLVNPVDRLVSTFVHRMVHQNPKVYDKSRPNMTFEECFFNKKGDLRLSGMVRAGEYHTHLLRYLSFFPPEQLHVVDGERLKKAPWEELVKIEKFLGLPAFSNKDKFFYNKERGFYCHRSFGCLIPGKGRPHPMIDPEKRRILEEHYKPHNEELFKLLNRTFEWSK